MRADVRSADGRLAGGRRRRFVVSEPAYLGIALAAAAAFAFPIFFMVTSAFKAEAEIQAIPMHWLPQDFRGLAHFIAAGNIAPLWRYFLNSIIIGSFSTLLALALGTLAAYAFSRFRFPGGAGLAGVSGRTAAGEAARAGASGFSHGAGPAGVGTATSSGRAAALSISACAPLPFLPRLRAAPFSTSAQNRSCGIPRPCSI